MPWSKRSGTASTTHHRTWCITLLPGVQYLSICYTERLAEAGVGSIGDSYDNSLVEYATLEWVDWFNTIRLLGPIGDIPPAEHEANYYRQTSPAEEAGLTPTSLR